MHLWLVEHFCPHFFPDQHWSGKKCSIWSEVHLYRSNFLQNPLVKILSYIVFLFFRYMSQVDKALKAFEYTTEWADLIAALGKLNKVLLAHMKYPIIPRRIVISKVRFQSNLIYYYFFVPLWNVEIMWWKHNAIFDWI